MVGENIAVVISRISGNRVTIGIEAPSGIKIIRGELGPLEAEEKSARKEPSAHERVSDLRQWRSSIAPAVAK